MEARRSTRGHLAWKQDIASCQLISGCSACHYFVYFLRSFRLLLQLSHNLRAFVVETENTNSQKNYKSSPKMQKKFKIPPKNPKKKYIKQKKQKKLNLSAQQNEKNDRKLITHSKKFCQKLEFFQKCP